MRKHPVLFVWFVLFAVLCSLFWSERVLANFEVEEPVVWDVRLAARAAMNISELLGVIGHGVTIASVDAADFKRNVAVVYYAPERRIFVDASSEFSDETLLFVMGHECAHAMFFQGGFLERNPDIASYQHVVHEVAADVLGAHLAGRVISRRGGDGKALTFNLLEESHILRRRYLIGPFEIKDHISTEWDGTVRTYVGDGYWLDPNYGAERLNVVVSRICREHDDMWEAARTIANELHNVDVKTVRRFAPADDWRPQRPERDRSWRPPWR